MTHAEKPKRDINNVESKLWLPHDRRYYINKYQYVDKYGGIALALIASKTILNAR